jgi:hypothetical protein
MFLNRLLLLSCIKVEELIYGEELFKKIYGAVLSNKKRISERARKRRFRKKLKKAGGKVEIIRFSVVYVQKSSNNE